MSDQNDNNAVPEETEANVETQEVEAAADSTETELQEIDPKDRWDPDRALTKIKKLNAEVAKAKQRITATEAEKSTTAERATALEAENMRLRVAVKHGIPESLVKRLTGTTEEEILQDAEELMELFGSKTPPTQRPKEKLRSPGDPGGHADVDVEKVVQRVFDN